ncbi:MAG: VOC family protein [Bacteroidales bacterium]
MEKIKKDQTGGIVFFKTQNLQEVSRFYTGKVGCKLWLDQGGCHILQFENMLIGFCQRENADIQGMITFYYPSHDEVNQMYKQLKGIALSEPKDNPDYKIYHFFAKDPEGRSIEFQYFWDE